MGLREKVALATVAVITAQILCSHCMPRGLPNCSVKSYISSLISPKTDSIREFKTNRKLKKISYNNIITGNSSKVLHLPNVDKPTDFEAGGYYRFYSDYYPHEPKKLSKTKLQTRNFKREANQRRYLDIGPRDKDQPPIKSSGLASEPPPQPYCFRKSSFFPEVDYPLSARDLWIPKYWSRLLDVEVPRNIKTDAPIYRNQQNNTKSNYSSYENSPLYDIIKTLNNKNKADTDRFDPRNLGIFVPEKSEDKTKDDGITRYRNLNTTTTVLLEHNTQSEYTTPDIHSGVLPYTKTTTEAPVFETVTVSSVIPVTSAITMATEKQNFFTPPYTTTPMIPNKPTPISLVTSSKLKNSDFDVIGATPTLTFEDYISPITQSIASADNFISLPTTVASMQPQKQDTSLSESNIERATTPELLSFIPSTEKKPEQELRDHTTPMQSTILSPIKRSDIQSDFDKIGVSTASPSDLFTSPMTPGSLTDYYISHTQPEKVSTIERDTSLSESNTERTTTPELHSFISSTEKKPEQELRDHTTPVQSTILSSMKSSDVQSDFDKIDASTASPSDLFTSPMTPGSLADNYISHTQPEKISTIERETYLSETNTERTTTPELLSFISLTEKKPGQELRDHTTPVQSTILSSMKSSDVQSDFDKIDASTASPSDLFTSPMTPGSLADNYISHTQPEKISTIERETYLSETNTERTTTPELLSFISLPEKEPEQELRDHTTPMQSTISSPMKSSDIQSDFDKIGVSTASPSDLFTSPMTLGSLTDNYISHTQPEKISTIERDTSLSESNAERTTTPELQSFISSTEKKPEQELRDHTTPVQSTILSSMKSSDVQSDFDKIDASTASPSDFFTSPMTPGSLADNYISHTQPEKISALLSTATSTRDEEEELRLTETNTVLKTTTPVLSFSSTIEYKLEKELKDTTPMRSTPNSKFYSDDKVALTDSVSFFSNSSGLLSGSNLTLENTRIVNDTSIPSNILQKHFNDLDTNESLLKNEILKNHVDVKLSSIPSSSTDSLSDHQSKDVLLSADLSFPENPNQVDIFQGPVIGYYYENSTNDNILQLCVSHSSNSSIVFTGDCKENWVYNPNDSYITWESVPECSAECFIFVDNEKSENPSSSTVYCNDNNLNVTSKSELSLFKESKNSGDVKKNLTFIPDSPAHTVVMEKTKAVQTPKNVLENIPKSSLTDLTKSTEVGSDQNSQLPGIVKNPADNELLILENIGNTTTNEDRYELQGTENYLMRESTVDENIYSVGNYTVNDLILYFDDMNTTSENINVDVDETWASYTEIPDDSLVLYLKDVNDTRFDNGNEYVLYQQIPPEVSNDT